MATTIDNDVHSRLNPCRHAKRCRPGSLPELHRALHTAAARNLGVAVAGGRHAMGGQQFCRNGMLLDMAAYSGVRRFDGEAGTVTVAAGTQWPLIGHFLQQAHSNGARWAIRQKQTGADSFSIGGSLAANAHGRGLAMRPLVADVEAFRLLLADGSLLDVDRDHHPEIFAAVIGGYGLLGVVEEVTLRLMPEQKLERRVDVVDIDTVETRFAAALADGCSYGDFQFSVDPGSDMFLHRGIFSRYQRLPDDAAMPAPARGLDEAAWRQLMHLAHVDKRAAFRRYAEFYLSTSGQRYRSGAMQMSLYPRNYHADVDARLGHSGSEMITELYLPDGQLVGFMAGAARWLRGCRADVVYGTVRRVLRDCETLLPWARHDCHAVVFNLHVRHDAASLARAREAFRGLIDLAIGVGGNYYLTYHRWASAAQFRRCYPRFGELLARKREFDPAGRFASDWYHHQRSLHQQAAA